MQLFSEKQTDRKRRSEQDDLFSDPEYISSKRHKVQLEVSSAEELQEQRRERHELEMELLRSQIQESVAKTEAFKSLKEFLDNKTVTALTNLFTTED